MITLTVIKLRNGKIRITRHHTNFKTDHATLEDAADTIATLKEYYTKLELSAISPDPASIIGESVLVLYENEPEEK